MTTQPALFVSHGTLFEAMRSEHWRDLFRQVRETQLLIRPDAIVVVSGHWLTPTLTLTTAPRQFPMDEGFPPDFRVDYQPPGAPELARQLVDRLASSGIPSRTDAHQGLHRGLDHGALIPLRWLYPEADVPVVQLSLRSDLDPVFHRQVGELLRPLRGQNVLFIGSGGLVHNRDRIVRFGGHALTPDAWATRFDQFISDQLADPAPDEPLAERLIAGYAHPDFNQAHPTAEHYLPLVLASAMGNTAQKIVAGFQWKNLSMSAFRFD